MPETPYPRGLNLIFVADGYLSWNEFESDAAVLMSGLRRYEPWQSFNRYNVFYVCLSELDVCAVKTEDERHPTLRCNAERLNAYLNQVTVNGPFKAVVLSRRAFESWANVARLRDSGIFFSLPTSPEDSPTRLSIGIQFAHLMGHAFGLKDEEIYMIAKADSAGAIPDGPNCAPDVKTAKQWWGDLVGRYPEVGYFEGCAGSHAYIKPTRASLMNLSELRSLVPGYGPVSERYLRNVLAYCFSEKGRSKDDDQRFFATYPEFETCQGHGRSASPH